MNWRGTQTDESNEPDGVSPSKTRRAISRREALLRGVALAGTLAFVESNTLAHRLDITHHTVPIPNLDRPLRVVQITDLHRSQYVSEMYIGRVVAETNALSPDIVLLTGDFVTRTSDYAESCMRRLAGLRATSGKYAVLGNHDYWCDGGTGGPVIYDWLEQTGIEVLTNRSTKLDNGLRLVGVDDLVAGVVNYPLSFESVRSNDPVLVMSHNPYTFPYLCQFDYITIAGHTHGGQICLPGISDLYLGKYRSGWYKDPGKPGRMYVSRGLGTIHVPMRILCAPELTVFDLVPGA
jgi:predicted MPP superfamily phosphohydrolase